MAIRPRLKKGDISINEIIELSKYWYRKNDDKDRRSKLDIKSGKISLRKGLKYNRQTKTWEQDSREVRIDLIVRTQPISYKDTSGIKIHTYPVTFLIKNWDKGFSSAFRWRVGSLKKPKFTEKNKKFLKDAKDDKEKEKIKKEKDKLREKNKKIQQWNIKNGIQLQFFFELSHILKLYGLLFGPDYTNGAPKITNPELVPFFDKHSWYIIKNILPKLFNNAKLKQKWEES